MPGSQARSIIRTTKLRMLGGRRAKSGVTTDAEKQDGHVVLNWEKVPSHMAKHKDKIWVNLNIRVSKLVS